MKNKIMLILAGLSSLQAFSSEPVKNLGYVVSHKEVVALNKKSRNIIFFSKLDCKETQQIFKKIKQAIESETLSVQQLEDCAIQVQMGYVFGNISTSQAAQIFNKIRGILVERKEYIPNGVTQMLVGMKENSTITGMMNDLCYSAQRNLNTLAVRSSGDAELDDLYSDIYDDLEEVFEGMNSDQIEWDTFARTYIGHNGAQVAELYVSLDDVMESLESYLSDGGEVDDELNALINGLITKGTEWVNKLKESNDFRHFTMQEIVDFARKCKSLMS